MSSQNIPLHNNLLAFLYNEPLALHGYHQEYWGNKVHYQITIITTTNLKRAIHTHRERNKKEKEN